MNWGRREVFDATLKARSSPDLMNSKTLSCETPHISATWAGLKYVSSGEAIATSECDLRGFPARAVLEIVGSGGVRGGTVEPSPGREVVWFIAGGLVRSTVGADRANEVPNSGPP